MARKRKNAVLVEKYHYDQSELHFSPSWCTASYRLAEKQRQIDRLQAKIQNGVGVGQLMEIIDTEKFYSFAKFSRHIFTRYPALVPVFLQNDRYIRDYINSNANDHLQDNIENAYSDKKALEEKFQGYFEDFQAEMQEKIAFRESQIADLERLLNKLVKRPDIMSEYNDLKNDWSEFESSHDLDNIDIDQYEF